MVELLLLSARAKCEATLHWVNRDGLECSNARTQFDLLEGLPVKKSGVDLPNEMAKVAAGEYATESEVIRDGLRVLLAVEKWLHHKVVPAYDALKANPSRAVSAKHVRTRLAAEDKKATAKR